MVGLFVALPLLIYQVVRFIEPALAQRLGPAAVIKIIFASYLLAATGAAFGFYVIVPTSLHFFNGYSTAQVKPLISATEYLSYVISVLITFALLFQIPLIALFINRIRPIKPSRLLRWQRHIIVAAFLIAVVLPFTYDPVSQFILAIPIVGLYYLSVILIAWTNRGYTYPPEPEPVPKSLLRFHPEPEPIAAVSPDPIPAPVPAQAAGWVTVDGLRPVARRALD